MPSITITSPTDIQIGFYNRNQRSGGGSFSWVKIDDGRQYSGIESLNVAANHTITWYLDPRSINIVKSFSLTKFAVWKKGSTEGDDLYSSAATGSGTLDIQFGSGGGGGSDYSEGKYRVLSPLTYETVGGQRVPIIRTESVQTLTTRDASRLVSRGYTIVAVPDTTPSFAGRDYPNDVVERTKILGSRAKTLRVMPSGRRTVARPTWSTLGLNRDVERAVGLFRPPNMLPHSERRARRRFVW